eukprot:c7998_g1_i1.p1 GENE.c7998_g1_i1~~c7998_g1_i1.p1  ORF type:complete len:105 (+),score=23.76 c7998_g1_i1:36-317(+)
MNLFVMLFSTILFLNCFVESVSPIQEDHKPNPLLFNPSMLNMGLYASPGFRPSMQPFMAMYALPYLMRSDMNLYPYTSSYEVPPFQRANYLMI